MEQRVTLVTLGVRDLARARAFYAALGWRGQTVQGTVFYQAGGIAVVLWDRALLAADCGLPDTGADTGADAGADTGSTAGGGGFGGIALAHNVRSPHEVDALLTAAQRAGGVVTRPARRTGYGGYAGVFTDPDGHPWEVAHNPGFPLAADGSVTVPDLGGEPAS